MTKTDTFRIDGHKLHLHPQRVADWLAGKDIAPIYMEVSPSGTCNHRCRFCSADFYGYREHFLRTQAFITKLGQLAEAGVKAIMFAGEGEPFMHKELPLITRAVKEAGIDPAFSTNAVFFTPDKARDVLPHASWLKVSCNAGSPESYAFVHGTRPEDFHTVLDNMARAVRIREEQGSACTLGFQMILLPENKAEALAQAKRVRDLGADYFVIKPYSVIPLSGKTAYLDLHYGDCSELAAELAALNTGSFSVIFRHDAMRRADSRAAPYTRCLALPFCCDVSTDGTAWTCTRHYGEEAYRMGNILDQPISEVFGGEERRQKLAWCAGHGDISDCHVTCRMSAINHYLWELRNPGPHVNFI
ncbi:radical SAM protein [Desulfovibrio sp. OttesenSCG-928-A18]|nr:radical SAM protein [Desulfovibrio sp. OttesenSCG-928-A18]